jgi:hypothetical protein
MVGASVAQSVDSDGGRVGASVGASVASGHSVDSDGGRVGSGRSSQSSSAFSSSQAPSSSS